MWCSRACASVSPGRVPAAARRRRRRGFPTRARRRKPASAPDRCPGAAAGGEAVIAFDREWVQIDPVKIRSRAKWETSVMDYPLRQASDEAGHGRWADKFLRLSNTLPLQILFVALAYFVTGRLGLEL